MKSLNNIGKSLQLIIDPNLENAQYHYKRFLDKYLNDNINRWLDVGCGHQLFPDWMKENIHECKRLINKSNILVGLDYDHESLKLHSGLRMKIRGDSNELPFRDATFSIVTANMVVEHLGNPSVTLNEIQRVLEHNGVFIFHTPNKRNYLIKCARIVPQSIKNRLVKVLDGREEHDIFPTYYRLNTSKDIFSAAAKSKLKVEKIHFVESTPTFSILGPFVIVELLIKKILKFEIFKKYRSNIIVCMRKIN